MHTKTILIVEDDYLNRRLTKKNLLEAGYQVLEAKNTGEAKDILKKEMIDLVVLDINLGDGAPDGISLGKEIKEKFGIPFIYLTAYENSVMINEAVATEPFSYLTKPFKVSDLVASIEIALIKSASVKKQKPSIQVKDGEYKLDLAIEEINHIESDGNYILFHTDTKIYKLRSTIAQILEVLSSHIFVQVHRAFVINKDKIDRINNKEVVVKNVHIPVSKNYTIE
jgi:DNA-binding LytR/AlgR family response regulator